jgi:multisubunit Na+/H+ antiporter MnhF subunit
VDAPDFETDMVMIAIATLCLFVLFGCMIACIYRMVTGPDALNRLIAFDLLGVLVALALALFAIIRDSWLYLEVSMGLAVLSVVATVAIAHFIERERIF